MGFESRKRVTTRLRLDNMSDFKYDEVLRCLWQRFKSLNSLLKKPLLANTVFTHGETKFGIAGSGMHCLMSLFDAEKQCLLDPNDPKGMQLSETYYHFLGGLIKHAPPTILPSWATVAFIQTAVSRSMGACLHCPEAGRITVRHTYYACQLHSELVLVAFSGQ